MDTNEQTTLAQKYDPKLAARIVLGVAELEQNYRLAEGPLSEQFITEAHVAVQDVIPDTWEIHGEAWELYITSPDWKSTRGNGRGDAWLEIGDVIEDPEAHSWIAVAVAAGPTQMCLELKFRKGLADVPTCFKASPQLATTIMERGFELSHEGARLSIPITIEADKLAAAFKSDDFEQALQPMSNAAKLAATAKQEIDDLVGLARTMAKKR